MLHNDLLVVFVATLMVSSASASELTGARAININITSNRGENPLVELSGRDASSVLTPLRGFMQNPYWNNLLDTPSGENLTDVLGDITPVDVAFENPGGNEFFDFSFSNDLQSDQLDLFDNFLASTDRFFETEVASSRIVFSDLPAGSVWDLYFISQGESEGQGGSFAIDGVTKVSAGSRPNPVFSQIPLQDVLVEGENFVFFDSVLADQNGEIIVTLDHAGAVGGSTAFQVLNGIQLQPLSPVGDELFCDVNLDGYCNTADLEIVRDNLFQFDGETTFATRADGDLDGSGVVDLVDYRLFKDSPTRTVSTRVAVSGIAIPEPAAAGLLVIAAMISGFRRRPTGRVC